MTVFEKVRKILAEYKDIDESGIELDSKFEDMGFDSLDTVELIMNLEDEFGISIEMSDTLKTVGAVVALIEEKQ